MMETLVPQHTSEALGQSNFPSHPHPTVLLVAHTITGGVVSTRVTIWLQVALLVQQSIARHVRVITHGQEPLVTVLSTVIATLVPQHTSTALGGSNVQVLPHSTVLF